MAASDNISSEKFHKIHVFRTLSNIFEGVFLRTQKQTLAQVFSCQFCEIFKNTFFIERLRTTASGSSRAFFETDHIFAALA